MDKKYKKDFPDDKNWNWKALQLSNPKNSYYKDCKIVGVILHDGKFWVNFKNSAKTFGIKGESNE